MSAKRRSLVKACLAIGAAPFVAWVASCSRESTAPESKPVFRAVDITGADYAQQLTMTDVDGKPRTLADFKGKVTVVFFGFTQCPDVCPATMAELAQAKRMLGDDGQKVQGVFVTLDPERDTADVLKAYMANFDPAFVALRGSLEETKALAREFKVFFMKAPGKTEASYSIDHTAGAFVFDTQGRVRLFSRYGSGPEALAADLKLLLAEAA